MQSFLLEQTLNQYFDKMDDKKKPYVLQVTSFISERSYTFHKETLNRPFHIFGLSKLFTAALINQLILKGLLTLHGSIKTYLNQSLLGNLFIFRNNDYMDEVTIFHLLTHTSGVNDYFEAILKGEQTISTIIEKKPKTLFHPMALVDITRDYQTALGVPGERFYYSDTGYVLLGLIIESVTNMTYQEALAMYIAKPLGLKHTYLYQGQQDVDICAVNYQKTDISKHQSLTAHYAGSGLVSTLEDLKVFAKAIFIDGWLSMGRKQEDINYPYQFSKGLNYGLGMMSLDLHKLPFLVRTQKIATLYGHMSFYGTHIWYEPKDDILIILNYGTNKMYEKGYKVISKVMNIIKQQT